MIQASSGPLPTCTSCLSTGTIEHVEAINSLICTTCGALADDTVFVNEQPHEEASAKFRNQARNSSHYYVGSVLMNGTRRVAGVNTHQERQRMKASKWLRMLLNALDLLDSSSQVKHLFRNAMKIGKWKWGRQAELVAASCIYIVVRQDCHSHALVTIADLIRANVYDVARIYSRVKDDLDIRIEDSDPSEHVDRAINYLARIKRDKTGHSVKDLTMSVKKYLVSLDIAQMREVCLGLVRFSAAVGLEMGRKSDAVGGAIVLVAMEGITSAKLPGQGPLAKAFGQVLQVSHTTILGRYREIHEYILAHAMHLPFIENPKTTVVRSKVSHYILDVMLFWDNIVKKRNTKQAVVGSADDEKGTERGADSLSPERISEPLGQLFPDDEEEWNDAEARLRSNEKLPIGKERRQNKRVVIDLTTSDGRENTLLMPPSYKRSYDTRTGREASLQLAKARVRGQETSSPHLSDAQEQEVQILQRLVLAGVNDSTLVTTRTLEQLRELKASTEENADDNISESEIDQYLRSHDESNKLKRLNIEQDAPRPRKRGRHFE